MALTLALACTVLGIDSAMLRIAMPGHFHQVAPQTAQREIRSDHGHGGSDHHHARGHEHAHDHDPDRHAPQPAETQHHVEVGHHHHDFDVADVVYVADDASAPGGAAKRGVVTTDGIVPSWVLRLSRLDAARFPPARPSTYHSLISEPPDPPPRPA